MADAKTFQRQLGQKVGPLPAVVWLGLFGIGAYLYQRRKGAGTPTGRPEVVLPGQSSYYSTISNVNYPPGPSPEPVPQPSSGPPMCPPGHVARYEPGGLAGWHCVPIANADEGECPPGQHMECGPGDSPCVCVNNVIRGPLPPSDTDSPPIFGPARPGGKPGGVELPVRGVVSLDAIRRPAIELVGLRKNAGGAELVGAIAGQRATAKRRMLRAPLDAAQRATELAPGLVGLRALEEPMPERGRPAMPPAPALRQRPAPPRIMDNESQRNVKHVPAALSG